MHIGSIKYSEKGKDVQWMAGQKVPEKPQGQ